MQIKNFLLIPLIILLGIFLGYLSHQTEQENASQIYTQSPSNKAVHFKDLHTPKYLSAQFINLKTDYIESRPKPKNQEEEIIAYYEDTLYNELEKKPEVYEENGTVYLNLNGHPKAIASNGKQYDSLMIPKLSASKNHIAYQICDDKYDGCVVMIQNITTKKKKILEDASFYAWNPNREVLIYDGAQKDDGHVMLESELFLFYPYENSFTELTNTKDFVETQPIFSKDGADVYCADEKTGKLLHFNLFPLIYRDTFIKEVKLYTTTDKSLDTEAIKKHKTSFQPISKDEKFTNKNLNYWIELEVNNNLTKGIYLTDTYPYIFDKNSFSKEQLTIEENPKLFIPSIRANSKYTLLFNYDPSIHERHYYFHLSSYQIRMPFSNGMMKINELQLPNPDDMERYQTYTYSKEKLRETIFASVVIGMILMSALYTMVMFVRRRDQDGVRQKAFIYYTLMQVSMAFFLFTLPLYFRGLFSFEFISMPQLSLLVAFFATLFTQEFLESKQYLPRLHTFLNIYLVFIIADAIWIFDPILLQYKLYEVFALLFLVTAVLRIKDGFKPAWFYLFGWIGLLITLFLMDFYHMSNFLMYVGVFIEAVMLAWGLVFHAEEKH